MTMRTLTIGDRTISYDTGLDYMSNGVHKERPSSRVVESDEGTNTSTTSSEADYSGAASVCSEDHEDTELNCGDKLTREGSRKLIKPDLLAMSQLLNFDEEEEDGIEDEEEDDEDSDQDEQGNVRHSTPQDQNKQSDWHKTVVKDLTQLKPERVERRHSITLCESSPRRKKSSSASSAESNSSDSTASSKQTSPKTSFSRDRNSCSYQLNTSQMAANLQEEYNSPEWQRSLQTLNLSLEEVAHIRSALTKAELEGMPLDGDMKENVVKGKVCFLCMKTKFGIFSRGQRCDMCKQCVCAKCYSKMRIPVEHFSAMPVYALSPSCLEQQGSSQPASHQPNPTGQPTVGGGSANQPPAISKLSVPGLFPGVNNTAGSAPTSPGSVGRTVGQEADLGSDGGSPSPPLNTSHDLQQLQTNGQDQTPQIFATPGIATISGGMESLPPGRSSREGSVSPSEFASVSLPHSANKFATLPKNSRNPRRWSMISNQNMVREKLEGSLLAVCTDCKEMVLQVIRTSRTTRKMQLARSLFFSNLSPAPSFTQHRV